jgi:outer membrane biosynthesis protein TonB
MPNDEKLLTIEEQDVCQKIAASGGLASQRAAALLAIDQGATRAQTSEQTGLTLGQIGYLLHVFGQKHLDLFPDASPPEEEEQPPAEQTEAKGDKKEKAKKPKDKKDKTMAKAKKKDKKPKKDKSKAKVKKGKKDKASKKDKESKKDKAAKKKSKKK